MTSRDARPAASRRSADRSQETAAPGGFQPRRLTLRDGRSATIRSVRMTDAPGLMRSNQLMIQAGHGIVRTPAEMPGSPTAQRVQLRQWITGKFRHPRGVMLVAVVGRTVVGAAVMRRERLLRLVHVGHVGIGLRPDATGLGLGRALMLALIDWARDVGVNRVTLDVIADNHRAILLYTSLGFVVEGRRRRHVREPDGRERDDLMMALLLDEPAQNLPRTGAGTTARSAPGAPPGHSGGGSTSRRSGGDAPPRGTPLRAPQRPRAAGRRRSPRS